MQLLQSTNVTEQLKKGNVAVVVTILGMENYTLYK